MYPRSKAKTGFEKHVPTSTAPQPLSLLFTMKPPKADIATVSGSAACMKICPTFRIQRDVSREITPHLVTAFNLPKSYPYRNASRVKSLPSYQEACSLHTTPFNIMVKGKKNKSTTLLPYSLATRDAALRRDSYSLYKNDINNSESGTKNETSDLSPIFLQSQSLKLFPPQNPHASQEEGALSRECNSCSKIVSNAYYCTNGSQLHVDACNGSLILSTSSFLMSPPSTTLNSQFVSNGAPAPTDSASVQQVEARFRHLCEEFQKISGQYSKLTEELKHLQHKHRAIEKGHELLSSKLATVTTEKAFLLDAYHRDFMLLLGVVNGLLNALVERGPSTPLLQTEEMREVHDKQAAKWESECSRGDDVGVNTPRGEVPMHDEAAGAHEQQHLQRKAMELERVLEQFQQGLFTTLSTESLQSGGPLHNSITAEADTLRPDSDVLESATMVDATEKLRQAAWLSPQTPLEWLRKTLHRSCDRLGLFTRLRSSTPARLRTEAVSENIKIVIDEEHMQHTSKLVTRDCGESVCRSALEIKNILVNEELLPDASETIGDQVKTPSMSLGCGFFTSCCNSILKRESTQVFSPSQDMLSIR